MPIKLNPCAPLVACQCPCSTCSTFTGECSRAMGSRNSGVPENLSRAGVLKEQDKEETSDKVGWDRLRIKSAQKYVCVGGLIRGHTG